MATDRDHFHCGRTGFTLAELLVVVALIALVAVFWGCDLVSRIGFKRRVAGQVFIVTEGRDNIKLGLVRIHIIPLSQLKKTAAKIVAEHRLREQQHHAAMHQRSVDVDYVQKSFAFIVGDGDTDLTQAGIAGGGQEILVAKLAKLKSEFLKGLGAKDPDDLREAVERLIAVPPIPSCESTVNSLFGLLPAAATITDADGRFSVDVRQGEPLVVLARARRETGNRSEKYLWIVPAEHLSDKMLLANNLIVGECGFVDALRIIAEVGPTKPYVPLEVPASAQVRKIVEPLIEQRREVVE